MFIDSAAYTYNFCQLKEVVCFHSVCVLLSVNLMTCSCSTVKPGPPGNLSHVQTIEAELILHWDDPPDSEMGPLRYEVRYSANTTHPSWQVTLSNKGNLSCKSLHPPRIMLSEKAPLVTI